MAPSRIRIRSLVAIAAAAVMFGATALPAPAAALSAETVRARRHFFGAHNVDAAGKIRSDRVILSWFSVAGFAMAIDGKVVLLDSYIHKGEETPNYVPTTTEELVALRPSAVFVGHGHFDHAHTTGVIAARTGALVVGTPEHCDQAKGQAGSAASSVRCLTAVRRGSAPGARATDLRPLGPRVSVTVLKHVHSAFEMPDGEPHDPILLSSGVPDPNLLLMHPPGPGMVTTGSLAGDENGTLLYQFRIGRFSLVWHDSAGPLRERAPELLNVLRRMPPTDVQIGAVIGFNSATNGMRDPVDYVEALRPKIFYPNHHDFVLEYGMAQHSRASFERELGRRRGAGTEVRWLYDPHDYLRPDLLSFDLDDPRYAS